MRDKLRKWREDNCRNSEQIVDVGEELIGEHASKLGDDGKCVKTEEMSGYMIAHPSRELFFCFFFEQAYAQRSYRQGLNGMRQVAGFMRQS